MKKEALKIFLLLIMFIVSIIALSVGSQAIWIGEDKKVNVRIDGWGANDGRMGVIVQALGGDYDDPSQGIANYDNVFCISQGTRWRNASAGDPYTRTLDVKAHFIIRGDNASVKWDNGSTETKAPSNNAGANRKMAWIVNQDNYDIVNGQTKYDNHWDDKWPEGTVDGNGNDISGTYKWRYYTNKQKAIYNYIGTWMASNGFDIGGHGIAPNAGEFANTFPYDGNANLNNYVNGNIDGANISNGDNWTQDKIKTEIYPNNNKTHKEETKYLKIGPFKYNFSGDISGIEIKDQNGNNINGVQYGKMSGTNLTIGSNYKDYIKTGNEFWLLIKIDDNVINSNLTSISFKMNVSKKVNIINADIWIFANEDGRQQAMTCEPSDGEQDTSADISVPSIRINGDLKIEKVNANNENVKLNNVKFKIRHKNLGYIGEENGKIKYDVSEEDAKKYETANVDGEDGVIKISNLLPGTYIAEEVENDNYGYEVADSTNIEVKADEYNTSIIRNTQKYIKLSGYVWVDKTSEKQSYRNNLYRDSPADDRDELKNGVIVRLKERVSGGEDKELQMMVSGGYATGEYGMQYKVSDGRYEFNNVLIADLDKYYIEFEYDGLTYQNVEPTINNPEAPSTDNGQVINNGVYKIRFSGDTKYVVDGAGANDNVHLWESSNVKQQEWEITYKGDGYYTAKAMHSNKYLNVYGQGTANGTNVIQYPDDGSDAMLWRIEKNSNGTYTFKSKVGDVKLSGAAKEKGLCLDVNGATGSNGTNVQVYEGNNSAAQQFVLEQIEEYINWQSISNGTYEIKPSSDNEYDVEVENPNNNNASNLKVTADENKQSQYFSINYIGDGDYTIESTTTITNGNNQQSYTKALEAIGNNAVQAKTPNNSDNQKWKITSSGEGVYYIISKTTGQYLEVQGNSINGATIGLTNNNSTEKQKFKLERNGGNGSKAAEKEKNDRINSRTERTRENFNQSFGFVERNYDEKETYTLGDVNLDNQITREDSELLLLYSVKGIEFTDIQKQLADITGDGQINASDALQILRATVGEIQLGKIELQSSNYGQTRYVEKQANGEAGNIAEVTNKLEYKRENYVSTLINSGQYTIPATTTETGYNIASYFNYGYVEEIENINLGLYEREQPNLILQKDIDNVRLAINGYEHTYEYNNRANEDRNKLQNDMVFKFEERANDKYSRPVYPSDVEYIGDKEMAAYVTYKITMINGATNLSSKANIVDYYDDRYEDNEIRAWYYDAETNQNIELEKDKINVEEYHQGGYNKVVINTLESMDYLDAQHETYMYIQFKVNREFLEAIMDDRANPLENIAEIESYSTYSKNENGQYDIYAGVDVDSAPENLTPGVIATYENDNDRAPAFDVDPKDERTLSGSVFEDNGGLSVDIQTNQTRQGDRQYIPNTNGIEHGIEGVTVTLKETSGSGETYGPIETDSNGNFTFTRYIPGDYEITYTWGGQSWTNPVTGEKTTYTVQNYKGTDYKDSEHTGTAWYKDYIIGDANLDGELTQEDVKYIGNISIGMYPNITETQRRLADVNKDGKITTEDGMLVLMKINGEAGSDVLAGQRESNIRYSDAMDNYKTPESAPYGSRQQIDDEIKEVENNLNAVESTAELYEYKRNKMNSTTAIMNLGIEYTDEDKQNNASTNGNIATEFNITNIDFGIIERPKQALISEKRIKHVKLTLTNGMVLIDADVKCDSNGEPIYDANGNPQLEGQTQGAQIFGPSAGDEKGLLRIEIDNEIIQGAVLDLTYELVVRNISELDYNDENFYLHGDKPPTNANVVKIKPVEVFDYLDNEFGPVEDEKWETIEENKYLEELKDFITISEIKQAVSEGEVTIYKNAAGELMVKYKESGQEISYSEWITGYWRSERKTTVKDKTILKEAVINAQSHLTDKWLEPGQTERTTLESSKKLSNKDNIELDNSMEVVKIEKNGGPLLQDDETILKYEAERTIVIPNTGEDRNYIPYIIAGISSMIILIGGIVIIKKKVL